MYLSHSYTYIFVGDSRTSLGYRNTAGGITAVNLTVDHKPDLPAEKV
jgi:serine/threonine protein phosphatase PrpC